MPNAADPTAPPVTPVTPEAAPPGGDRLAPFRAFFGLPVAVQFAVQTPYLQIQPMFDKDNNPQTRAITGADGKERLIGFPAVAQGEPTLVAIGVLHPAPCGTWLVVEELLGIPRTAESPGGSARMDVLVRPEMVTHVSFVKEVNFPPRRRGEGH